MLARLCCQRHRRIPRHAQTATRAAGEAGALGQRLPSARAIPGRGPFARERRLPKSPQHVCSVPARGSRCSRAAGEEPRRPPQLPALARRPSARSPAPLLPTFPSVLPRLSIGAMRRLLALALLLVALAAPAAARDLLVEGKCSASGGRGCVPTRYCCGEGLHAHAHTLPHPPVAVDPHGGDSVPTPPLTCPIQRTETDVVVVGGGIAGTQRRFGGCCSASRRGRQAVLAPGRQAVGCAHTSALAAAAAAAPAASQA